MNKIKFISGCFTFYLLLFALNLSAQWSTAALSQGRSKAYSLVVGHKAFFIGGEIQSSGGNNSKVVDIYNDSTGLWSSLSLSFATRDYLNAPAIAHQGQVFVIQTGETPSAVLNVIDAAGETVRQDTLSLARTNMGLGAVGDWVVFAGGNTNEPSARVDLYHTRSQTWSQAELSVPRSLSVCGTVGNKLFIAGGITKNAASARVDIFDATTGTWDTASLGVARSMMRVVQVGHKLIFAGGGVPNFVFYDAVDIYDAATGTWSTAKLSQQVYANILNGVGVGDRAFFTGGTSPRNVDVYDAATDTWQTLMAPSSHQLNPVVANGGRVFFAGGLNNPAGQVDVYHTATNQWVDGGKLSVPRYYAAGAAVGNKVLIAGGINNSAVVDIYTLPASNSETPGGRAFEGTLAPNPAGDWALLTFPAPVSGRLSLFDARGTRLLCQDLAHATQYTLSLAALPAGRYIWQWIGEGQGRSSGQVVVVR